MPQNTEEIEYHSEIANSVQCELVERNEECSPFFKEAVEVIEPQTAHLKVENKGMSTPLEETVPQKEELKKTQV